MPRYFLEIAFRGTHYHGWQLQPGAATVQGKMEEALAVLLGVEIRCVGCGRTDAGVHAHQFYLHFDTDKELNREEMVYRLNGMLDRDIAVADCLEVADDAHARFDATERTYRYFIHQKKNPFLNDRSTFVVGDLDVEKMNEVASMMTEMKDFKAFAKVNTDVKHHLCDLHHAGWTRTEDQLVFEISANRFLRNMVRAVVGTMLEVGLGKISRDEFVAIVENRDRRNAGKSVDARGLFLHQVKYPYIA